MADKRIDQLDVKGIPISGDFVVIADSEATNPETGAPLNKKVDISAFLGGGGSGAFATALNVTSNSPGDLDLDDFVFGSDSLDDDADIDHYSRFQFRKLTSTFYAGYVSDSSWNAIEGCEYCAIFGENNFCEGNYSGMFGATNSIGTLTVGNLVSGVNIACTGSFNIVTGEEIIVSGDWNGVFGDWHDDIAGDNNLIGGTSHNILSNTNIISGSANNISATTASNNAIFGFNNSITAASAQYNLISGNTNTTTSSYNLIAGRIHDVQGQYNLVVGEAHTVNSGASHSACIGGSNVVNNLYQVAIGNGSDSDIYGAFTRKNTQYGQEVEFSVNGFTAGSATTTLFGGSSSSNRITLRANTVYSFTAEILGVQESGGVGSAGDMWKYRIKGLIKRDGANNTTYIVDAEEKETIYEDDTTCDVAAAADDTNEALQINVTGNTNRNIRWVSSVKILEMLYV